MMLPEDFRALMVTAQRRKRTMLNYGVVLHVSTKKAPTITIHVQYAWINPRALLADSFSEFSGMQYIRVFVQLHWNCNMESSGS